MAITRAKVVALLELIDEMVDSEGTWQDKAMGIKCIVVDTDSITKFAEFIGWFADDAD